ncbi:uncharacterized protein znf654 [Chanos chanos]|uniref:Uncharacterized protein znf654 n=1 Tax=Chanos chanos TaxID=29144 RepID=A0A6J2VW98_CHACN|nr:zinc finger protein 654 [Chanos chanos]
MAEEESELELDRFKEELESLFDSNASDEHGLQSKSYCARFCELVEEHTSRWQVPLPQLQVLQKALCSFVRGAALFPSDCEHVRYTLSSLALSIFELLLFFGKDEFPENPLKDILDSFQDCHSSLVRHQNVYLLQLRQIIKDGGPWANSVLQGILQEWEQPREEVDRYLNSEVSVFFELRVRYLLACERIREAMALAKSCSQHPTAGRHLFFMQAYLTCLWKASHHERLHKEMAEIDGKDAVEILCMAENEEKEELLLDLCKGFLSQQLISGDMYYLWDLVFLWSKLYLRVNSSKQGLLEECKQMIMLATNIKAIFPYMKVILSELGKDGLRFCVELCARALQTDLKNDPVTKSLIYKTIAYLLPNDLEVCRICALLVFFLERTVESYKTVFLLYTHPDQEYHGDSCSVGNSVRFEVLQILKKGLCFDPEFWNLFNIKTNCLKLMSDKVAKATLLEIMEDDKWVPNNCIKGPCRCWTDLPEIHSNLVPADPNRAEKRPRTVVKQVQTPSAEVSSSVPPVKRRGRKPGTRLVKVSDAHPVRRSFRQLDMEQENRARQLNNRHHRLLTRQVEGKTLKRRGRKPRWLLEEAAAQAENSVPRRGRKPGRKPKKPAEEIRTYERSSVDKTKQKDSGKDISSGKETVPPKEETLPAEAQASDALCAQVPDTMLEFCLPENEVILTDTETSPVSAMDSIDKTKMPQHKTSLQLCEKTSALSEAVSSSTPRVTAKDREVVILHVEDNARVIRQFHSYSKSFEVEGIGADTQACDMDDMETSPVTVQERPMEDAKLLHESTETHFEPEIVETVVEIEVATHIPAETTESPAPEEGAVESTDTSTSGGSEEAGGELTASVENGVVICEDGVADDCNVDSSKDISLDPTNDEVVEPQTPEVLQNTPAVTEGKPCSPDSTPDIFSAAETTVSGLAEQEHRKEPVVPQTTEEVSQSKPEPKTTASDSVPQNSEKRRIVHCCRLCNKVLRIKHLMRHALIHARLKRKCIFCKNSPGSHPVTHISEHLNRLKQGKEPGVVEPLKTRITDFSKRYSERLKIKPQVTHGSEVSRKVLEKNERFSKRTNGVIKNRRQINKMEVEPSSDGKTQRKDKQGNRIEVQRVKTEPEEHMKEEEKVMNGATSEENASLTRQEEKASVDHKEKTASNQIRRTEACQKERTVTNKKRSLTSEPNKPSHWEHKKKAVVEKRLAVESEQKNGTDVEQKEKTDMEKEKRAASVEEKRCFVVGCMVNISGRFCIVSHVLNDHPGDGDALEGLYNHAKQRCLPCARKFSTLQHFLFHVGCHKGNPKHPCPHKGCKQRFKTLADTREHMKSHHPLVAACTFPGCSQEYDNLHCLHKHEKSHYRPSRTAMNSKPKCDRKGGEREVRAVPSKERDGERVELSANEPKANHPDRQTSEGSDAQRLGTENTARVKQDGGKPPNEKHSDSHKSSKSERKLVNGHSDGQVTPSKGSTKEDDRVGYGKRPSRPYIRPPPTDYLDERYISMPKRRKESPISSNHSTVNHHSTDGPPKRQRCSRCFSSFNSAEELETHRSTKKCTSLFDFDSDDESAC